jgi:BRCA1-associated protein
MNSTKININLNYPQSKEANPEDGTILNSNIITCVTEEIKVCSICLESLQSRKLDSPKELKNESYVNTINGIIYVLCGHYFHIECLMQLDDDKCPLCRYYLSPVSVSSCSLCTCENDLWICLICGSINCGEEGGSNNHKKEHFSSTGHIYAKGIGENIHNITFDFSRNSPLNLWFQNSLFINTNDDMTLIQDNSNKEIYKNPKEKVEFIISEYNSILSSQLESQRFYYINLMRKIEDSFLEENNKLDNRITNLKKEFDDVDQELISWTEKKNNMLDIVKQKEIEIKNLEKIKNDTDLEYKKIINKKERIEHYKNNIDEEFNQKLNIIDGQIEELQNQLKDLNIHINTLNNISKNKDLNEISGASIGLLLEMDNKSKKYGKKNKK